MGFRDFFEFNKTLLGKQAWRILHKPNSLLSRLYIGRYHRSSTFLQSANSTHASYGWRSIQVGKELLKKGLSTLIGDGTTTKVWSDHWLPVLPPRMIRYVSHDPDMKVSDLICPTTKSWNGPVLEQVLDQGDVELVKQIKLSRFSGQDTHVRSYSRNLEYSVKSGYWVAIYDLQDGDAITPPMGSVDLKMQCWKLNVIPKIKVFLWKVLLGALATYVQLCS